MYNNELVPPCGLYCGVCGIYHANKNNDTGLMAALASAYGVKPEQLECSGCMSDRQSMFCRICKIKDCAAGKGIEGCHKCDSFPCGNIESFPVAEGKKNILRSVPVWEELGTEEWIRKEEELFTCGTCGSLLFRGARKCKKCGTPFKQ